MKFQRIATTLLLALAALPLAAQETTVTADPLLCIRVQEHGIVGAQVENEIPGTEVRVYFRRMHEVVEDFYYIEMEGAGNGRYWSALPKPAKEKLERIELEDDRADERVSPEEEATGCPDDWDAEACQNEKEYPWAAWWKRKERSEDRDPNQDLEEEEIRMRAQVGRLETRHWMDDLDLVTFENWLEELQYEPAEYYAAVVDHNGEVLAKSATLVTEVMERDDCDERFRDAGLPLQMTEHEQGFAFNLTVGETSRWQMTGEERENEDEKAEKKRRKKGGPLVFHWLCDHVVTRIDFEDVIRADDACRACVIAWWKREEILVPLGLAGVGGILIDNDNPPPVSPSQP